MTPQQQWLDYLAQLQKNFVKLARLDFLNPDGSIAFSVDNDPRNYRSKTFIQDGTISVALQNGTRRQASITLSNVDKLYDYNVNKIWFGQQIRLMEGLILSDGTDYYLPQGVFYIKDPEESLTPGNQTVTYNLTDKWAYLDGSLFGNLDGIYEVPLNSSIQGAIASLLLFDRGNGYVVDPLAPVFTDYYNDKYTTLPDGTTVSMAVTPYTYRCDSENGTYADIVLEMNTMLAGLIGYDQTGRLRQDPSQDDIADNTKPVQWDFSLTQKEFLGASYTVPNSSVYNDIIVEGGSLDGYSTARGRAQNQDPRSDTNIFGALGKRTLRLSRPAFYSNTVCQDQAAWELKRLTVLQKSITINSSQIFHLVENNIVTIRRDDKPGTPIERHLLTGFSRPIAQTGTMTLNATSVQDFPVATIS